MFWRLSQISIRSCERITNWGFLRLKFNSKADVISSTFLSQIMFHIDLDCIIPCKHRLFFIIKEKPFWQKCCLREKDND